MVFLAFQTANNMAIISNNMPITSNHWMVPIWCPSLSPRRVTMAKTPVSWAEVKTNDPTFLADQRIWDASMEQKPIEAKPRKAT